MEFSFTREQEDLRGSVRAFLKRHCGSAARNELLTKGYTFDRTVWTGMARQLGLTGLALPEAVGGSDAGFIESCIVAEELGRDLYAGPYFSTVAASWILEQSEADGSDLLTSLADGSRVFTLAVVDEGRTWAQPGDAMTATRTRDAHRLSGAKINVTDAGEADSFIVLAHQPGGLAWFHVSADAEGVNVDLGESLDLTRPVGRLVLQNAPATLLVGPSTALELWEAVHDKALVLLASEMVAGAEAALQQSVTWSTERTQFGRPVGSFQALKHLCADALVEIEAARVLAHYAAWAVETNSPDRKVVASMAKQAASDAFTLAAGNNIQIHGGIGFTWEHTAHLYFRRAKASSALFGTPHHHRNRIADLLAV